MDPYVHSFPQRLLYRTKLSTGRCAGAIRALVIPENSYRTTASLTKTMFSSAPALSLLKYQIKMMAFMDEEELQPL